MYHLPSLEFNVYSNKQNNSSISDLIEDLPTAYREFHELQVDSDSLWVSK